MLKKEQDKKAADETRLLEATKQLADEEQARAAAEARASRSKRLYFIPESRPLQYQDLKYKADMCWVSHR